MNRTHARRLTALAALTASAISITASSTVLAAGTGDVCEGFDGGATTTSGTIGDVIADTSELSTFADVLDRAGLTDALGSTDSLTVFAPTDEAFAAIPPNVLTSVLDDPDLVATIAGYHVVPADAEPDGREEAAGVCAEITVDNGTIIVVDAVLMPPAGEATGASSSIASSSVPAFGPDEQAVAVAFETAVDSSLGFDEQAPFIEGADALRETIENYPVAAEAVLGIRALVTDVSIDGDVAEISYVLYFNDVEAPYGELDGTLINVDGAWMLSRDEYCAFQAQARNNCPA